MRRRGGAVGVAIAAAVVLAINCGVYSCSKSNCEERGGHIEWVYGRTAGWTCDGANR